MDKARVRERLRGRDFLSIHDFKHEEIAFILNFASELKAGQIRGENLLTGKTLGLIFEKSSTRTRVSFEVGMFQLGGYSLFLNSRDLQIGRGETIGDTARVLSRYLDGVVIRTFDHHQVEELAAYADVPVINGLTDLLHPCQVMADLLTIQEKKGKLAGIKLAYIGDGNNMAHSLLFGGAKTGMHVTIACPPEYQPLPKIVEAARRDASVTGALLSVVFSPQEAIQGADVVYTDVWSSMGQEQEQEQRKKVFAPYQINEMLMRYAGQDAIFMHCLPAHRGEEVTAEVIDGPCSVVFDQAENRLHVQKAILALLMG